MNHRPNHSLVEEWITLLQHPWHQLIITCRGTWHFFQTISWTEITYWNRMPHQAMTSLLPITCCIQIQFNYSATPINPMLTRNILRMTIHLPMRAFHSVVVVMKQQLEMKVTKVTFERLSKETFLNVYTINNSFFLDK